MFKKPDKTTGLSPAILSGFAISSTVWMPPMNSFILAKSDTVVKLFKHSEPGKIFRGIDIEMHTLKSRPDK